MNFKELLHFYQSNKDKLNSRDKIKSSLKNLIHFPITNNQCIYVLNYQDLCIDFCKGMYDMLGYHDETFELKQLMKLIHKEDEPLVNRLMEASLNFSLENNVSENVSFVTTYRAMHKNGTYRHVMRHSTVFETDSKGRIISSLSTLTDISFLNLSKKVDWHFEAPGLNLEKFRSHIQKTHINLFSDREMQIIQLLNKAYSSQKIADKLHLSKHTIDTHRRNLLGKTNSSNTIELLNFCTKNNIL